MSFVFYLCTYFIAVCSAGILAFLFLKKNNWRLIGPFSVALACYFYYCGAGPLILSASNNLYWNGYDLMTGADAAGILAVVSFLSFLGGWFISRRKTPISDRVESEPSLLSLGICIWIGVLILQVILVKGNLLLLFNVANFSVDDTGLLDVSQGLANYLTGTISFMFFAILCVYQVVGRKGTVPRLMFHFMMVVPSVLLFVATGFRLRVVALLLALSTVYYVCEKRTFNRIIVALYGLAAFVFAAVMGAARAYGRGVQMDVLSSLSVKDIALSGVGDSGIFYTTGMVARYMQDRGAELTWFNTYYCGLTRAIPSDWWPNKPMSQTLQIISMAHGDDANSLGAGFFMPFFGENYVSFGYVGVVIGSLLFGFVIGWSERKLLNGRMLPALGYALVSAYVFIYFHRGLFPQQLDFFVFIFLPVAICWLVKKRLTISRAPFPPGRRV